MATLHRCKECALPCYTDRSNDQCYYHWMYDLMWEPCIICFLVPNVFVRPSCCNQQFCKPCWLACLQREPRCPHCRRELPFKLSPAPEENKT